MNDSLSISAPKFSLRPLKEKDAPRMLEWMNDPDSTQFLRIGDRVYTLDDTLTFIKEASDESKDYHRAIVNNRDDYLGTISLKNIDYDKKEAEYAIAMHPSARSTGAALWASYNIFVAAFLVLMLKRVYLNVRQDNIRAIKFYSKLKQFGLVEMKTHPLSDELSSLKWYEIKSEDFMSRIRTDG